MPYEISTGVNVGEDQVFIAITHGLLGSHLGIAYQDETGEARLLHLAFHKILQVDPFPQFDWLSMRVPIDEDVGAQIVALLNSAAKLYPHPRMQSSFDYGINLIAGHDCISPDGSYEPKNGCDGYTCSSFVAEIFRTFGLELVDLRRWPSKWANKVWGRAVVCLLSAEAASVEHIAAVERNNTGLRLRPEEVAAAAEMFNFGSPRTYSDVFDRAGEIMNQVINECGSAPQLPNHHKMRPCVEQYHQELRNQPFLSRVFEQFRANCLRWMHDLLCS